MYSGRLRGSGCSNTNTVTPSIFQIDVVDVYIISTSTNGNTMSPFAITSCMSYSITFQCATRYFNI